jgi:hypothetical protein
VRAQRFYLDLVGIALLAAGAGYFIATRGWFHLALWGPWLVVAIVRFSNRYGPAATARQAVAKRRQDAEREYERRETWDSWSN